MIDFDRLVLRTAMNTFAVSVTIMPVASQPSAPSYSARGVWDSRPVDVQAEDGGIVSSQSITLGIRLSEFTTPPAPRDKVVVNGTTYLIEDTDDDGQGGTILTLKAISR